MYSLTRFALPAVLAGVVAAAIACGGGESADTAITGTQLVHGEDSALGCGFAPPGKMMSELTVRAFSGKGAAKDNFGDHSADTTIHEVAGVGDSAAVLARGEHVNFLIVQKGRKYVQLVTTFVDDINLGSAKLKEAQDLALKAIDRMP